jgi:SAM-dependent methyltransferase
MCNAYGILFAFINLKQEDIQDKKIIEVGSKDVNGSVRPLLEYYKPKQYIGVDISKGLGVDIVCNAERLLDKFQPNSFDVVISTEMLEHVRNWQKVISNLKALAAPEGLIYISTRSVGYDFWRYEISDIQNIFSDCLIVKVERDPDVGVFAKIRKPTNFKENDLSAYHLYCIVTNKQQAKVDDSDFMNFLQITEKSKRLNALRVKINPVNWLMRKLNL